MISEKIKILLLLFIVGVFGFFVYFALTKYEVKKNEQESQTNLPISVPFSGPSIDDPNSIWIIVNKKRSLSSMFAPSDLEYIGEEKQIRAEAAAAFQKLMKAAKQSGLAFKVISGDRSYSDQVGVYNGWVKRDGQIKADTYSARSGYSEHQTGLAVDLGNANGDCDLDICFGDTVAGKWLAAHAYGYGFIIRFPVNKSIITGYQYEPWHIRYVGVDLAQKLQDSHQTMEEYFGLPPALSYFEPSSLKWEEEISQAPWSERDAFGAIVFKDKIWLMGGLEGGKIKAGNPPYGDMVYKNDIWVSENGKDWNLVKEEAEWGERRSLDNAIVVFKDKIWLMGGWTKKFGETKNDVWVSEDGINWKLVLDSAPWSPREGHTVVVFKDKIWLTGGVDFYKREIKNDAWYSEDGVNWIEATSSAPWLKRYDHTLTVFQNKLWLIGGLYFSNQVKNDVWVSEDGINWQLITNDPPWPARHGHVSLEYKNKLWIIGGWCEEGKDRGLNDTWYSIDGLSWKKIKNDGPWFGREDHKGIVFKDKIWIMGGMTDAGGDWLWENDIWYSTFLPQNKETNMPDITIDVIKIFTLGAAAFILAFWLTPVLTLFLYKHKLWRKEVRTKSIDGRELVFFKKFHSEKEVHVPRFGGLLVWLSTLILAFIFFLLSKTNIWWFQKLNFLSRSQTWLPLFALIAASLVGLLDDILQVFGRGKYIGGGLRLKYRLVLVILIGLIGAWWFYFPLENSTIHVPGNGDFFIGAWYIPLFVLVMLATYSGGVIDGLDGLAGGVFAVIFAAFGGIALFQNQIDLAAFCMVIAGAILAFLWFNIPPARFYMGETGMLGLCCALTVVAFLTDSILVLPIIGFLLVIESGSVILQLISKKIWHRKVFLAAPIHHHFEAKGWPHYKITMRFWVIGVVMALIGLAIRLLG